MTHRSDRSLSVAGLARVEGEGAMHVHVDGDRVTSVQLEIYEPPRFFEALLVGRGYTEAPDITARVCGIWSGRSAPSGRAATWARSVE